jgi:hypothetical protein
MNQKLDLRPSFWFIGNRCLLKNIKLPDVMRLAILQYIPAFFIIIIA